MPLSSLPVAQGATALHCMTFLAAITLQQTCCIVRGCDGPVYFGVLRVRLPCTSHLIEGATALMHHRHAFNLLPIWQF